MSEYVIKSWKADVEPIDQDGNFVHIVGRSPGLLAWLLSVMRIDPTVILKVTAETVTFERGSVGGSARWVIPLTRVSSLNYGYAKPWREALLLGLILLPVCLLGLVAGPLYYYRNQTLRIGLIEVSGVEHAFLFRRSVLGSRSIDEQEASYVASVIRYLADRRA